MSTDAPSHNHLRIIGDSGDREGGKASTTTATSVTDSAYDSLVCSPFSPTGGRQSVEASVTQSPLGAHHNEEDETVEDEDEDIFCMSLEQLAAPTAVPSNTNSRNSTISSSRRRTQRLNNMNVVFRPISTEFSYHDDDEEDEEDDEDEAACAQCTQQQPHHFTFSSPPRCTEMANRMLRTISTQTAQSIVHHCRPNSAPLQEYSIQEEMDEINIDGSGVGRDSIADLASSLSPVSSQTLPRNSNCSGCCLRPSHQHHHHSSCGRRATMPDVIPPLSLPRTSSHNVSVASRLSLIADQIDQHTSMTNLQSRQSQARHPEVHVRRHRRLSTSAISDASGSSLIDLCVHFYQHVSTNRLFQLQRPTSSHIGPTDSPTEWP